MIIGMASRSVDGLGQATDLRAGIGRVSTASNVPSSQIVMVIFRLARSI